MKPQRCIVRRGEHGDCWRACIATILNMPSAEVPNFAAQVGDEMWRATRDWLDERGLALFEMACSADYTFENLVKWRSEDSRDVPVIVVGAPRGVDDDAHAVIAMNGKIVHDPSGAGISGPAPCSCGDPSCTDKKWWLFVIAFGANSELKKCATS